MIRFGTKFLASGLARWIDWVLRFAHLVVALSILVTAALLYYTVQNISISTDTDTMIDPELEFRKAYAEFNETFPQFSDSFLVLIDATKYTEGTRQSAESLRVNSVLFLAGV